MGERWGEHIELVVSLVEQSLSDIEHEFHRKVTAAKARLRALMSEIPESEQAAVAAGRQSALYSLAYRGVKKPSGQLYVGELVNCPVCTHSGALCTGPLREDHSLGFWIEPEDLRCRVCGVFLDSADELRLAGIPPRLEITEKIRLFISDGRTNFDVPDDFYDEGPWSL